MKGSPTRVRALTPRAVIERIAREARSKALVSTGTSRRVVSALTEPAPPAGALETRRLPPRGLRIVKPGEPVGPNPCEAPAGALDRKRWRLETRAERDRVHAASEDARNRAEVQGVIPRYVRKCPRSVWNLVPYQLLSWEPGAPKGARMGPAFCRSWRCEGECRRHNGRVLWRRILDALNPYDSDDVVFMVLTLDRNGTHTGEQWADSTQAYRELARMTAMLQKRLTRMLGRRYRGWVGVIEAHRSGWPHANLILVWPELARELEAERQRYFERTGNSTERCREHMSDPDAGRCVHCLERQRDLALVRGRVFEHVLGAGWGPQTTAERARSREAVAGYVCKVAGTLDENGTDETRSRLGGEVAKITQIPMSAPKGFRRVRSSQRFLPPRYKGSKTGGLLDDGRPVRPQLAKVVRGARIAVVLRELARETGDVQIGMLAARVWAAQLEREAKLAELGEALETVGYPEQAARLRRALAMGGRWQDG